MKSPMYKQEVTFNMKVYVQIFESMDSRTKKRWECFVIARSPKTLTRIASQEGSGFFRAIGKPYTAYATPCLIEILAEDSHDAVYAGDTEDYIYR